MALFACNKSRHLLEPQFSSYLMGLLCGLHKTLHVKFIEQWLVQRKHLLKVRTYHNYEFDPPTGGLTPQLWLLPFFQPTLPCLEREKDHSRNWNLMWDTYNTGEFLRFGGMLILSLVTSTQGLRDSDGRVRAPSVQRELVHVRLVVGKVRPHWRILNKGFCIYYSGMGN